MYGPGYGYGWMHGSPFFGGGLLMLLMWLVPIALVIAFAFYLARRSNAGPAHKTALDILEERYARGEIGKDEFEQKKRDITR